MKWALVVVAVFLASLSLSCGKVAAHAPSDAGSGSANPDAQGSGAGHTCVFDTDTFDSGCTFGP